MKYYTILLALCTFLLTESCNFKEESAENSESAGIIESLFTTSGNNPNAVIDNYKLLQSQDATLVRKVINDNKYVHGEALSIMVPEQWQVSGQILWNEANVALPAVMNLIAEAKTEHARFEAWPTLSFLQLQSPFIQPGQYYGGALVVSQLPEITTVLQQYLLPYFRKGINFQITVNEDIRSKVPNLPVDADARMIILEYMEDGVTVEEKILGMKTGYAQGGFASAYIMTYAYKTKKGEAAKYEPLFTQMFNSIKYSDAFNAAFKQISGYSYTAGMNNIAAAGKTSQQISANNDAMLNQMQQQRNYSHNQPYGSNQYNSEGFNDYILGQGTYTDPNSGTNYKLDYNYKQNWSNGNGTIIQSHDPNYNPNIGGTGNWYELEPK